jgi:hypothetical protein
MHKIYVNIDMKRTGQLLKFRIDQAGYSVKDIQRILMLSCPQPIYRWYNGKILPSVDHLYTLNRLLDMHMEDLLVPMTFSNYPIDAKVLLPMEKRLFCYWEKLNAA